MSQHRKTCFFFRQLLLQPLWLNNLFLNPTISKSITPICKIVDLFRFSDIWSVPLGSLLLPTHTTRCSITCTLDHNCNQFWASCIPPHIIDFAVWCSPHDMHIIPLAVNNQNDSTMFALELQPPLTHEATVLLYRIALSKFSPLTTPPSVLDHPT